MNDLKSKLMGGMTPYLTQNADIAVPPPRALPPGQKPKNVMICLPSGRTWEARTATFVAGMMTYSAMQGVQLGICNLESSMITKGRNDLVGKALEHGAEYIQWIDTDMVGPPDTLMRLLAHNKDIVGATYNKRVPPYETLGKLKGAPMSIDEVAKGGLVEAEEMPGGCMLVKTDVYRRIRWPYYSECYEWEGETGTDKLKNFLRDNYAVEPPREVLDSLDGTAVSAWLNDYESKITRKPWSYYSEDLSFCRKVRKAGYRLWCDLSLTFNMTHLGTQEVRCAPPQPAEAEPIYGAQM